MSYCNHPLVNAELFPVIKFYFNINLFGIFRCYIKIKKYGLSFWLKICRENTYRRK